MDVTGLPKGAPVYCAEELLGTLVGSQGTSQSPLLAVQPQDARNQGEVLLIPASYVARVENGSVWLSIPCADARLLVSTGAATASAQGIGEADVLRIPVIGERLQATTNWAEAGALEIRKTVNTVTQEMDVPVRYEQATVERVALNRVLVDGEVPSARQEGDVLVVPVVHEEVIVTKRRVLVEELRITKTVQTRTQHVAEAVRQEELSLDHPGLDANNARP